MTKQHIGVIGLGVMGRNLALNIERNGFSVAGYDLDRTRRRDAADAFIWVLWAVNILPVVAVGMGSLWIEGFSPSWMVRADPGRAGAAGGQGE